jgi:hypothetical protein
MATDATLPETRRQAFLFKRVASTGATARPGLPQATVIELGTTAGSPKGRRGFVLLLDDGTGGALRYAATSDRDTCTTREEIDSSGHRILAMTTPLPGCVASGALSQEITLETPKRTRRVSLSDWRSHGSPETAGEVGSEVERLLTTVVSDVATVHAQTHVLCDRLVLLLHTSCEAFGSGDRLVPLRIPPDCDFDTHHGYPCVSTSAVAR